MVADAEVEIGVEGGHDLSGVTFRFADQRVARGSRAPGLRFDRGHDFGIAGQALDEDLAPGLVKGRHLQLQPRVELGDDAIDLLAEEPAHAGNEHSARAPPMSTIQRGTETLSVMQPAFPPHHSPPQASLFARLPFAMKGHPDLGGRNSGSGFPLSRE